MANSSLFNLSIDGLKEKPAVLSFNLMEGIYGDDSLSVSFVAPFGSLSNSLVGREANFSFEFESKKEFFNGVIAGCSVEQAINGISRAELNVKTLRHLLDKKKSHAVFCNSDVDGIVNSILKNAGVLSVKCKLNSFYMVDFKIQYNESDLIFLQRLLEDFNIIEFVKHSEKISELVISDSDDFEKANLTFVKSRLETTDNGNFFLGYGHRPLRPGTAFEAFGETFVICSAVHSGSQEAAYGLKDKKDGYTCQIAAFSKQSANMLPKTIEKPKVPGVIVAKTEGFIGPFATIDSVGRYVVRMPFDSENFEMASSVPVHLAQSYAGVGYGVHFPLRSGTPVLIAFENGDIDKPIALGAIPEGSHTGPVIGANSFQNILRTTSGIELVFNDATASLSVDAPRNISVKTGKELSAKADNVTVEAAKNISVNAGKTSNKQSKPKGNLQLKAPEKIFAKAGKGFFVKSNEEILVKGKRSYVKSENGVELRLNDYKECMNIEAPGIISIKAGREILLKGNEKCIIKTQKGIKISLDDSKGSVDIEAPMNISIKAGGRLTLKGKTVEIN